MSEQNPEAIIEAASREFETAREAFETLSKQPIEGDFEDRVRKRTDLAMAEVRYRTASNRLNQAVADAVNEA